MNEEGKSEAKKILNLLQTQLSRNGVISELDAAINQCRTEIQIAFDRVIEWFSPAGSFEHNPFPLEDAISVAEAIVKDTTPNFSAPCILQDQEQPIMVNRLPTFIDIMINVFENVVKRSGLETPVADVESWVEETDNGTTLRIKVQNEIGANIDKELLLVSLEEKRDRFKSGDFEELITRDQGSGFFKIYQGMIDLNPSTKKATHLNFGIVDNTFYIDLSLPAELSKTIIESEIEAVK